jgi:hypothetical protein
MEKFLNKCLEKYSNTYDYSEVIYLGSDENKTEHEIMLERNIYRVYDCGTITYELNL